MSAYLVTWPNGDLSVVEAESKARAVLLLDEVGTAEKVDLRLLPRHFMLHLKRVASTDQGHGLEPEFAFEAWGEETMDFINQLPVFEELEEKK